MIPNILIKHVPNHHPDDRFDVPKNGDGHRYSTQSNTLHDMTIGPSVRMSMETDEEIHQTNNELSLGENRMQCRVYAWPSLVENSSNKTGVLPTHHLDNCNPTITQKPPACMRVGAPTDWSFYESLNIPKQHTWGYNQSTHPGLISCF